MDTQHKIRQLLLLSLLLRLYRVGIKYGTKLCRCLIWGLYGLLLSFKIVIEGSVSSDAPSLSIGRTNQLYSHYHYYCLLYNDTGNSAIVWTPKSGFDVVKLNFDTPFSTKIDDPNNFQMSFSFRIDEVHILLCEEDFDGKDYHRCYYITLGGYKGKVSFLRKCQIGEINTELNIHPIGNCRHIAVKIVNDSVINSKEWHHFSITKKENTYTVWKYGWQKPVLSYTDSSNAPFLPKYVLLRRYAKLGLAKIHQVNAFVFEKSTLANLTLENPTRNGVLLFVKACEDCIVAISLQDGDDGTLLYSTQITQAAVGWQQVILKTDKGERRSLRIVATVSNPNSVDGDGKWYIGDTILGFLDHDIVSLITIPEGCCYALTRPQYKICTNQLSEYDPGDWQCTSNSLGRNCIPCKSIFHTTTCQTSPICDLMPDGKVRCSCPAGLQGSRCEKKCSDGSFGFDCRRKCGNCMGSCKVTDGACNSKGCRENFKGKRCDTPIMPIARYGPTILKIGHTYVQLSVNMEFEGERRPLFYKLQFKKENEMKWSTLRMVIFGFDNRPIPPEEISYLTPNVMYQVRTALLLATNESYEGPYIPFTSFRTMCADINLRDLLIELTNTTFSMNVNVHSSLCPLNLYEFTFRNDSFKQAGVLKTENHIRRLTPNSIYILTILKSGQIIIEEMYRTDVAGTLISIVGDRNLVDLSLTPEAAEVQNVQITEIGDRYVVLQWQEPHSSGGTVENYVLEYKIVRYLNCEDSSGVETSDSVKTTNKDITIRNLHPYAEYTMQIMAFTKYTGPPTTIWFNTTSSNISKEDIPIMQFSELQGKLVINITWNCKQQNGPTDYDLLLFCESSWCNSELINSSNSAFHKLKNELRVSFDVFGFTMYRIELKIFRAGFPPFSVNTPYKSLPRALGKVLELTVHSVNRSAIGLRWRPPYPPFAVVDYYELEARSEAERLNRTVKRACDPNNYCNFWKSYICCTCSNLEEGVMYTITVKAVNFQIPPSNHTERVSARAVDSPPGEPQNITLNWDDEYNLTVKWLHPSQPNGPITGFIIFLNNLQIGPYDIDEELPEYEYHIDAEDLTAQKLIIKVGVQNAISISYADDKYTTSPPRKPSFIADPILEEVNSSFVRVAISNVTNQEGICVMFAVLTDLHPSAEAGDSRYDKFFKEIGVGLSSWLIASANSPYEFPKEISYHNNQSKQPAYVAGREIPGGLLRRGHSYQITIVLRNTFEKLSRQRIYRLDFALDSRLYLFALLLIPGVLIVVIIFVLIRYLCINKTLDSKALLNRNRQSIADNNTPENDDHIYETPSDIFVNPSENNPSGPSFLLSAASSITGKFSSFKMLSLNGCKYKNPVSIKKLDSYVKTAMNNGDLAKQFEEITKCPVKPSEHGDTPENRLKNIIPDLAACKYAYIIPTRVQGYIRDKGEVVQARRDDHSRVKLENLYEDPYADYINANYINGYDGQKGYIATQGPKDNTINDFWRMIWDEKVQHIIVVSGVIEGAQRKFEKYWPEINGFEFFDEIKVNYIRVEVFANYEIRHFDLVRDDKARQVKQVYFTCSHDIGTSQYIRNFASFSKRILSLKIGEAPIVVHGRGGFGRTGILILCDICLRMALAEGKIDIYHHLYKLRQQRINMVENIQQYKIAHFVLLLILQCINASSETGIVCTKMMSDEVEDVIATKMEKQLKFLDDSAWQDEAIKSLSLDIDCPTGNPKRRLKLKLDDFSEASFYPYYQFDNDSQIYIRAEIVDSLSIPSRFVTTKNPTASTLSVFWQLIIEKQLKMIICLHKLNPLDTVACMFYPTSNAFSFNPLPNTSVKFVSKYNNGYCDIYNITVTYDDKLRTPWATTITVIQLKEWHQSVLRPDKPNCLIATYESMNDLGKLGGTILVTCHDGIRACGVYVALCYLLEKIKSDHVCDVCLAVRTVRQSRKEFVRPLEQFKFLYECGLEYVRQFETYANFKSATDERELS